MTKPLSHVFSGIAMTSSKWLFAQLVALFVGLVLAFWFLGRNLPVLMLEGSGFPGWVMTWPGTNDIADMELLGNPAAADLVLDDGAWAEHRGKLAAITFLDYVFIYVYSVGLALVLTGGAVFLRHRREPFARLLAGASWLPFVAGGLDAIENGALLSVLAGRNLWVADIAKWCAAIKFSILAVVFALIAIGLVVAAYTKWQMWRENPQPAPDPASALDSGQTPVPT